VSRSLDEEVRRRDPARPKDPASSSVRRSEKSLSFEYGLEAFGGCSGAKLLTLFGCGV